MNTGPSNTERINALLENGDAVAALVEIFRILRAPEGCPWDRKQSHASLKEFLREEAAELLDAIDAKDDENIREELGDVLLQVVFHCQIAEEAGKYNLQDAAQTCCEKMLRRHPHVFGTTSVDSPQGVKDQWDKIKKKEKGASRSSSVSGVPKSLPALHRAHKIQKKAAKAGFEWQDIDGFISKIDEELEEVKEALTIGREDEIAEEIGDLLFAVVNLSRFHRLHAEDLLHKTVVKFEQRFRTMEEEILENKALDCCSLSELLTAWNRAKESLK